MSSNLDEFQSKFRIPELAIYRGEHWTWSVRPVHSTLGSGILSLNRFCESFAGITEAEAQGLRQTVQHIQSRLDSVFAPDKMNYLMLMMVDLHLHFHVLPRYSQVKTFGSLEWADSGWPKPPALGDYEDRSSSPVLADIRDALR